MYLDMYRQVIRRVKAVYHDWILVFQDTLAAAQEHQSLFEQLGDDLVALRKFVEHGRPGVTSHPDIDQFTKDVQRICQRYQRLVHAIAER
jgi:hypothetical protein